MVNGTDKCVALYKEFYKPVACSKDWNISVLEDSKFKVIYTLQD